MKNFLIPSIIPFQNVRAQSCIVLLTSYPSVILRNTLKINPLMRYEIRPIRMRYLWSDIRAWKDENKI